MTWMALGPQAPTQWTAAHWASWEYENFNAASARLTIQGSSIHPGSAKGRMKNAILIGMEFQSLLPAFENPMYTEGYEGFYHLDHMEGECGAGCSGIYHPGPRPGEI